MKLPSSKVDPTSPVMLGIRPVVGSHHIKLKSKYHVSPALYLRDGYVGVLLGISEDELRPVYGFSCHIALEDGHEDVVNSDMLEFLDVDRVPATHKHPVAAHAWLVIEARNEAWKREVEGEGFFHNIG